MMLDYLPGNWNSSHPTEVEKASILTDLELGPGDLMKRREVSIRGCGDPPRTQPFILDPQSKLIRTCLQPVGKHSQQTAQIRPLSQELDKSDMH